LTCLRGPLSNMSGPLATFKINANYRTVAAI
jgi:hypothetical protein